MVVHALTSALGSPSWEDCSEFEVSLGNRQRHSLKKQKPKAPFCHLYRTETLLIGFGTMRTTGLGTSKPEDWSSRVCLPPPMVSVPSKEGDLLF